MFLSCRASCLECGPFMESSPVYALDVVMVLLDVVANRPFASPI